MAAWPGLARWPCVHAPGSRQPPVPRTLSRTVPSPPRRHTNTHSCACARQPRLPARLPARPLEFVLPLPWALAWPSVELHGPPATFTCTSRPRSESCRQVQDNWYVFVASGAPPRPGARTPGRGRDIVALTSPASSFLSVPVSAAATQRFVIVRTRWLRCEQ